MKAQKKDRIFYGILYGGIVMLFLGVALCMPVGLYGDSEQFISMHVHREPVYPLWLLLFRITAGEAHYLKVVSFAQGLLNAAAVIAALHFIKKEFAVSRIYEVGVTFLLLCPHIMTPIFSSTHLVITCAVLNEAVVLPVFLFFVVECLKYIYHGRIKNSAVAFLLAMLLALTRGQMMVALIAWALVACGRMLYQKKYLGVFLSVLIVAASFPVRGVIHKTYNYVVNDAYVGAVCGNVNLVTNILYASDREAGERIENPEAQLLFYRIYDAADEQGLLYQYAGTSLYERAKHLEQSHDVIKFGYILEISNEYFYENVGTDYLERNIWVDDRCADMVKGLWSRCIGRWIGNYLLLGYNGLCRSIGIVYPGISILMGAVLILAIVLVVRCLVQKRNYKECLMMLLAGILIFGNAFATSILIMCLSRYMIYGFSFFYIALWLLLKAERHRYLERKAKKNLCEE